MFDPPAIVPYAKIDENELDSKKHRALARALANESMVLLKNDGTLPLSKSGSQNRGDRTLGGSDEISAGKLHRHADAHRIRARGTQGGISRGTDRVRAWNAISARRGKPRPGIGY